MRSPVTFGLLPCAAWSVLALAALGQCHGNGGVGKLSSSVQALGTVVSTTVTGNPGAFYEIWVSGGAAVQTSPGLGTICLDVNDPVLFRAYAGVLPASGVVSFPVSVPNDPSWAQLVYYLQGLVSDPTQPLGLALTNALRKDFESPSSVVTTTQNGLARSLGAVCHLEGRNWVFSCGGAEVDWVPHLTAATEIYTPFARLVFAGPTMTSVRLGHTATALADGRVLITGGIVSDGSALDSCEIFDPSTMTIAVAPPMSVPRYRHRALRLADGRVLVVGGSADSRVTHQSLAPPGFSSPYYNMAHDSGEVFDPVTNTWSPVANSMQTPRTDMAVVGMPDGSVLIVSGFDSAVAGFAFAAPFGTATCERYEPATNTFLPAPGLPPSVQPRGRHAATLLGNGDVLLTGGLVNDPLSPNHQGVPTASTATFVGGVWVPGPPLPVARFGHGQVLLPGGDVLIAGGDDDELGPSNPQVAAPESTLLFDSKAPGFVAGPTLMGPCGGTQLVPTNDGSVIAVGGLTTNPVTIFSLANRRVQLFTPGR